ncbi:hypothetical protein [Staphylococcus kloosii]|jgi:hypothetical protein|uniref:hypothetical protein n=1 Tax=Staphylococcus kloosii TaxID=29384 RepID=UPI0018A001FD|nr:hypothetical protein [Staphylococcus kloosii]MBF7023653.1 hypothetical protein [Staphylococcus kloosii]
MLEQYEYDFQLANYSLNNLTVKKKNEEFLSFNGTYKINSNEIKFKVYPMSKPADSIKVLVKFTIINQDFNLNIEYIAEFNKSTMENFYDEKKYYSKLRPAVFVTMYKCVKELAINVIGEVVGSKVILPIFDKRKIDKSDDM